MDGDSRLLLDLYRGARERPLADFHAHALALLKSRVRFTSGMWGAGELRPGTGLVIESIHLENQPEEMLAAYDEIKVQDVVAIEARRRVGQIVNFHIPDIPHRRQYAGLLAHSCRFEMAQTLVLTHHDPTDASIGFLTLWRAKESDRFAADDERAYAALLPHYFEAGKINRILARGGEGGEGSRTATAIAGIAGNLYSHDAAFAALLRAEWPTWEPPMLPRPLLAALVRATPPRYEGTNVRVHVRVEAGMLFLRIESRASAPRELTPAEERVARLIAEGCSYKEAASMLGVSPATVRNQLHSVYQKLGVTSRVQLARVIGAQSVESR